MSHPRVEEVSDSDPDVVSDPDEGDIDDFVDSDIIRRVAPATSGSSRLSGLPDFAAAAAAPPPPPPFSSGAGPTATLGHDADRSQYNSFQCLYPVYFDATRTRAQGRRVHSSLAVANPLAREIANACSRLRLPTLLEPDKTHPKDWPNPGRVKVGLKKTSSESVGTAAANNKHHLFRLVAQHLQQNPTTESSPALRIRLGGQVQPPEGTPYPRPAVPRGWKMGQLLPYSSPAMTGGGVSENLFKDMMKEMQGGGDPMSALMAAGAGGAADTTTAAAAAAAAAGTVGKKKKDKKGKGRS